MVFSFIYLASGIIINIIYIYFNIFYRQVRESCEYFSLSMNVNYLLGSIACLSTYIAVQLNLLSQTSSVTCLISYIGSCYLAIQSQLSIFGIFLNRFLLIRFPFKYEIFCSTKFTLFFAILCNIFSLFFSSMSFFIRLGPATLCKNILSINYVTMNVVLFFSLAPFLPSFIIFMLILKIAKKHALSIENQINSSQSISKTAKLTFLKLILSLVSWIIYGILYSEILKDVSRISWKRLLIAHLILYQNMFLSSITSLITNSKITSKLLKSRFFLFFKKKVHVIS